MGVVPERGGRLFYSEPRLPDSSGLYLLVRPAIPLCGDMEPVPVNAGSLAKVVTDVEANLLAVADSDGRPQIRSTVTECRSGIAWDERTGSGIGTKIA